MIKSFRVENEDFRLLIQGDWYQVTKWGDKEVEHGFLNDGVDHYTGESIPKLDISDLLDRLKKRKVTCEERNWHKSSFTEEEHKFLPKDHDLDEILFELYIRIEKYYYDYLQGM